MSPFTESLTKLEKHLQALIEGTAARLFPSRQMQHDLAYRLVQEMRLGVQTGPQGEWIGPNLFILEVNPTDAQSLATNTALLEGLTLMIQDEGSEAHVHFSSPPVIQVSANEQVLSGEVRVSARHSSEELADTSAMENEPAGQSGSTSLPRNAFLIVNGTLIFLLDQPVINIGRRADNHLVIDDARISRTHAQVRLVQGRFAIFDLGSTGGTWVNGSRIHQQTLQSGDVISLSGVPLVYGQESGEPDDTQKMITIH
jgi:hypothetical protein